MGPLSSMDELEDAEKTVPSEICSSDHFTDDVKFCHMSDTKFGGTLTLISAFFFGGERHRASKRRFTKPNTSNGRVVAAHRSEKFCCVSFHAQIVRGDHMEEDGRQEL